VAVCPAKGGVYRVHTLIRLTPMVHRCPSRCLILLTRVHAATSPMSHDFPAGSCVYLASYGRAACPNIRDDRPPSGLCQDRPRHVCIRHRRPAVVDQSCLSHNWEGGFRHDCKSVLYIVAACLLGTSQEAGGGSSCSAVCCRMTSCFWSPSARIASTATTCAVVRVHVHREAAIDVVIAEAVVHQLVGDTVRN
jgi:hypothetical protein